MFTIHLRCALIKRDFIVCSEDLSKSLSGSPIIIIASDHFRLSHQSKKVFAETQNPSWALLWMPASFLVSENLLQHLPDKGLKEVLRIIGLCHEISSAMNKDFFGWKTSLWPIDFIFEWELVMHSIRIFSIGLSLANVRGCSKTRSVFYRQLLLESHRQSLTAV